MIEFLEYGGLVLGIAIAFGITRLRTASDTKRALFLIAVLAAVTIWRVIGTISVTGSGGLGAVSVGFLDGLTDFLLLSAVVGLFFIWRHRRHASRQPVPRTYRDRVV